PGKRPLSSSVPTIIESPTNEVELIIGASGGSRIITSVAQAVLDVLEYGFDVWEAVVDPRAHHQLFPNMLVTEYGFDERYAVELEKRGHVLWRLPEGFPPSGVEAIQRLPDGTIKAASDPRKGGLAAGY
ncbi:Gamma-glutamyltranspeptidase 1, partial [Borealophlyctis nickersoniae]